MGVARQIRQDLVRPRKWTLGVDHPVALAQGSEVVAERVCCRETREIAKKLKLTRAQQCHQTFSEQSPEQPREHADRQEEVRPASNPLLAVRRDSARGDDAVDVRMMVQVLP